MVVTMTNLLMTTAMVALVAAIVVLVTAMFVESKP